ncbi:flavin reductase family protein [Propionibacterium sp.]|uniref:flavin reductase family protein n=1 Tax=Propionibacterium sp. TaxID=1977903 RepID=UPI0039EC2FF4
MKTLALVEPDALHMRNAMGRFVTGVAVVTAAGSEHPEGMTINSMTSITLDPAVLMISLHHQTRTHDAIMASGRFGLSILGVKQESVARRFASHDEDKFANEVFDHTESGIPLIARALVQTDCTVLQHASLGDHEVFFGHVEKLRYRNGEPLVFNAGHFGSYHDFGHDEMHWRF